MLHPYIPLSVHKRADPPPRPPPPISLYLFTQEQITPPPPPILLYLFIQEQMHPPPHLPYITFCSHKSRWPRPPNTHTHTRYYFICSHKSRPPPPTPPLSYTHVYYLLLCEQISSNWILMSCQPHRVTSGQSNSGHEQIHISKFFSHIYQPSVKSIYKTNHFTNIKHTYTNIRHTFSKS